MNASSVKPVAQAVRTTKVQYITEPRHSPLLFRLREFPHLTMVDRRGLAHPMRRNRSGDAERGRQQDSHKA